MSPDPLGGSLLDPQTLNRYSYVRNNPLAFTDPSGMYICADSDKCDSKQDKAFEKARLENLKSKDADVVRGAQAYGDPTKDNGVTVQYGDPGKGRNGNTESGVRVDPNDPTKFQAAETVTIRSGLSGVSLLAAVGHEGSHVADAQDFVNTITSPRLDGNTIIPGSMDVSKNLTQYQTEFRAYHVDQAILSWLGEKRGYGDCGGAPCILGTGIMPAQANQTINQFLGNPKNGYNGVTPANPGRVMYPNLTTPR
jgi:hypothetical protein